MYDCIIIINQQGGVKWGNDRQEHQENPAAASYDEQTTCSSTNYKKCGTLNFYGWMSYAKQNMVKVNKNKY